jgi:hypothetical protein
VGAGRGAAALGDGGEAVSDWKSLAAGVAIVFALVVALLSTLLAAKWAWRGRDNHNHS